MHAWSAEEKRCRRGTCEPTVSPNTRAPGWRSRGSGCWSCASDGTAGTREGASTSPRCRGRAGIRSTSRTCSRPWVPRPVPKKRWRY